MGEGLNDMPRQSFAVEGRRIVVTMKFLVEETLLILYSATGLDVVIMGPSRKSILSDKQM